MMDNAAERQHALIGTYDAHVQVEAIVRALERTGYDMNKLSVVAKGPTAKRAAGAYTAGDRMKTCGEPARFFRGLWEHLAGAAFLWAPGSGPITVAGPFADKLVDAIQAAEVMGRSNAFGAALARLGCPTNRVVKYESLLNDDKFLLIAHGTAEEVRRAMEVMQPSSLTQMEMVAA